MAIQTPEAPPSEKIGQSGLIVVRRPSELSLTDDNSPHIIPMARSLRDLVISAYDPRYKTKEELGRLVRAEYEGPNETTREYFYFDKNELAGSLVVNIWEMGTPEGDKYWRYFQDDLPDVKIDHKDPGFVRRAKELGRTRAIEIRGLAIAAKKRGMGIETALLQKAFTDNPPAAIYALLRDPDAISDLVRSLTETSEKPRILFGGRTELTPGFEQEHFGPAYAIKMHAFLHAKGLELKGPEQVVHLNRADSPAYKSNLLDKDKGRVSRNLLSHAMAISEAQKRAGWDTSVVRVLTATPQAMGVFSPIPL